MVVSAAVFLLGAERGERRMSAPATAAAVQLRRLAVLMATCFVDMIGFMIVLPLLPFYALELHAAPEIVGSADRGLLHRPAPLGAALGAGLGPLRPAAGAADRAGRLGGGLRSSSGCADSLAALRSSGWCRAPAAARPAWRRPTSADTVRARRAGASALGWLSAATTAGVMLGPAIGSFAAHLGHAAPGFVAAALCLVNIVFAWRWLPESRPAERRDEPTPSAGRCGTPRGIVHPASDGARFAAHLDLRHRHARVLRHDVGAGALSGRPSSG